MKNIISVLNKHRYFVLFILLFAYTHSIYKRISVRQQFNAYLFTPEAALATVLSVGLLFIIISVFIKKRPEYDLLEPKGLLSIFIMSLIMYMFCMQLLGLLVAWAFNRMEQNFNQQTFAITLFSDFLVGIIYGSFILSYLYYTNHKKHQQKLAIYNKALSDSKINQLKIQLNPHFLFNNLNILDQLIEEDKEVASEFLNEFAEIYRYVLQASDKELISIEEELNFTKQYFKLIQHKYAKAYQLHITWEKKEEGYIIPLSLQLLIENAVKHNLGTIEYPIEINIRIDDQVIVSNDIRIKNNQMTSGRALNNLQEQYSLLAKEPMLIQQTEDKFTVTVPIIRQQNI